MFSQGRQVLPFTRNSLSGSSIRANLCLGSWCRTDLITVNDLLPAIRLGKKERETSLEVVSGATSEAPSVVEAA